MSETRSRWLTVAVAFMLAGCAALPSPDFADGSVGLASWYGRAHHGQRTASGERFDMHAFTAAHRTLPFGTWVRVTNLENGRIVLVRINDRGPYERGRVIDVSHAAAQVLGMRSGGLARVRLELVPGTP